MRIVDDQPVETMTNYEREQAGFARLQDDLQRRNRRRWRLWLARRIAGGW